jgi:hypothetical protein
MEMAHNGRFRILATLWVGGLLALLLGGGYNLVTGSRTVLQAGSSGVSAEANAPALEVVAFHEGEGEPELATFMGHLQTMAHKLNLSIVAENPELSAFYLHEVEEVLEQIEELFPNYDGYPVSEMVTAFAMRALDPVDDALVAEDWTFASQSFGHFVESCNACHGATGHPFIQITMTSMNPFTQSFQR